MLADSRIRRLEILMPYCKVIELFQATDQDRAREFSSFEGLKAYLEDRYRGHLYQLSNLRAKHAEELAEHNERNYRDFGCTAILQNERGDRIQVGISEEFWLIFKLGPFRRVEAINNREDGVIVFYLPEPTEFYASELHYSAAGAEIVRSWLDTGFVGEFAR
jgi:hypothetical protein